MAAWLRASEGTLAGSEQVKLPVQQLLLRQLGEVVLSKRVPARHVGGVGWGRDPI